MYPMKTAFQRKIIEESMKNQEINAADVAEISKIYNYYEEGTLQPLYKGYENVCVFFHIKREAVAAIEELLKKGLIEIQYNPLYIGEYHNKPVEAPKELPLAKGFKRYSKPHLLPIKIKPTKYSEKIMLE